MSPAFRKYALTTCEPGARLVLTRLDPQAALARFLCQHAGRHHHARIGGVGARGDRPDDDGAVLERRVAPVDCDHFQTRVMSFLARPPRFRHPHCERAMSRSFPAAPECSSWIDQHLRHHLLGVLERDRLPGRLGRQATVRRCPCQREHLGVTSAGALGVTPKPLCARIGLHQATCSGSRPESRR